MITFIVYEHLIIPRGVLRALGQGGGGACRTRFCRKLVANIFGTDRKNFENSIANRRKVLE